jgi:hypothetical protein
MTTNSSTSATSRISTFVLLIVLITLALSLVALGLAVSFFETSETTAYFLLLIGFIGVAMSAYVLLQSRRHVMSMKIEKPSMMTTIECRKCGFKSVREFQRGDYVYKELEACQKCPDDKMIITAIYREVKEKEKTFPF